MIVVAVAVVAVAAIAAVAAAIAVVVVGNYCFCCCYCCIDLYFSFYLQLRCNIGGLREQRARGNMRVSSICCPISIATFLFIAVIIQPTYIGPLFLLANDFGNASCPRPPKLGPLTREVIRGGGNVKLQLQPRAAATAARIATEARVSLRPESRLRPHKRKSGDGSPLRSIPGTQDRRPSLAQLWSVWGAPNTGSSERAATAAKSNWAPSPSALPSHAKLELRLMYGLLRRPTIPNP